MPPENRTLSRGVIAGVIGALVLALWFFIMDTVVGEPLRTPRLVAGAVFGGEAGPALLAVYTALHFGLFVVIGVLSAWLLERTGTSPHFLLGVVLGFLLFDLVFYLGVVITGVDVVRAIGWPEVLIGNVLAGISLFGYLHLTAGSVVSWRQALSERLVLREGLIAGAVGAVAVAAWFFVIDLLEGRLLFTPSALGAALFENARSVADVHTSTGLIAGYTLVHVGAFVITGVIASALIAEAEKDPPILLGLALLFVTFEVLALGLIAILASWLLETIEWWTILLANVVAAFAMGIYLWRRHPKLQAQLGRPLEEEMANR